MQVVRTLQHSEWEPLELCSGGKRFPIPITSSGLIRRASGYFFFVVSLLIAALFTSFFSVATVSCSFAAAVLTAAVLLFL